MNDVEKQMTELLAERENLLQQVLNLTEGTALNKSDVEKYTGLMDERQKFFECIYEIDDKLKELDYDGLVKTGSADFKKSCEALFNASRAIAYRIKEKDMANKLIVEELRKNFKSEMKTVNEGRSVRNIYSDSNKISDGYYFDKTK